MFGLEGRLKRVCYCATLAVPACPCTALCTAPDRPCAAGFEACLNSRQDKPAELIAKYLDSILRRGSKAGAAQESSLEDVLDAALALFRYVQVGAGGWVLGAGCRQGQGRVWGMWCAVHALACTPGF